MCEGSGGTRDNLCTEYPRVDTYFHEPQYNIFTGTTGWCTYIDPVEARLGRFAVHLARCVDFFSVDIVIARVAFGFLQGSTSANVF